MAVVTKKSAASVANTDTLAFAAAYGGALSLASNWFDVNAGAVSAVAPAATNPVTVSGGGGFLGVTGSAAVASAAIGGGVLLWGTLAAAGTVALAAGADFELNGGARLTAGALSMVSAGLALAGASTVAVSGTATLNQGFVLAANGSAVQLGALVANSAVAIVGTSAPAVLAVDDTSSIEVGTAGGAALGALTIDADRVAAISGTIYGNVVANGTLAVQAGAYLGIDAGGDPFGNAGTIKGTGALTIGQGATLALGVPSSAAINFAGSTGTLQLLAVPSGTITGYGPGNVIAFPVGPVALATGASFRQVTPTKAQIVLTRGIVTVGTLTLAGNYGANLFHLSLDSRGNGTLVQLVIGAPPAQPGLIAGTPGQDALFATASGQVLTGLGGSDTLRANGFSGVVFKDTAAALNGDTITGFDSTGTIDVTDLRAATAQVSYVPAANGAPASLVLSDGTRAATVAITLGTSAAGFFSVASDGAAGTNVRFVTVNTDSLNFLAVQGGTFAVAANWFDTVTKATAAKVPGAANPVAIAGAAGAFTNIVGPGTVASLATSGNVLLWGSIAAGGTLPPVSGALAQAGSLALDTGGALSLLGTASIGGQVALSGGSRLNAAGGAAFTVAGASLVDANGAAVTLAKILNAGTAFALAVDPTASIEIGTVGNPVAGALTIDAGTTTTMTGTIAGSVALRGTLAVASGRTLALNPYGSSASTVTGAGTLLIASAATLGLYVAESSAIQFAAPSGANAAPAVLALGSIVPNGTISGFAAGTAITLARTVTSVSWGQTAAASGVLALFNGQASVGTLRLAGVFTASQFLLTPSADGRAAALTYMATPSATAGAGVNGGTNAYAWSAPGGGLWTNPGNWTDTTTGTAATKAPGPADPVTIQGGGSLAASIMVGGNGSAASLTLQMDAVLTGTLAVAGQFRVQGNQAQSALQNGASLAVGGFFNYAALTLGGRSALVSSGTADANGIASPLAVTGGSRLSLLRGSSGPFQSVVAVDPASMLELGAVGSPAAGAVTVDPGLTLGMAGTIAANLVVNGAAVASFATAAVTGFGGTVGTVTGSGTIGLFASRLVLNAAASVPIALLPGSQGSVLQLAGPLPTGVINGFANGQAIQVDRAVTGVSLTQASASAAVLALANGGSSVGTISLGGSFSGSTVAIDVAPASGVATLTVQAAAPGAGAVSGAVSATRDSYAWAGDSGGSWGSVSKWANTTSPGAVGAVPGSLNAVTVAGTTAAGQFTSIGGSGACAGLAVSGAVLLSGRVAGAGRLTVAGAASALALAGGAQLTAAGALVAGKLQLTGASSAALSGTATLAAGALLSLSGSSLQLGGLIEMGDGNAIAVDANSSIVVGASAAAVAGALVQAAGAPVVLTGSLFGNVVANDAFSVAAGGALFIDINAGAVQDPYGSAPTVTGSGTLVLNQNSTLGLGAVASAAIRFAAPGGVLALAALPTGTIGGFASGGTIVVYRTVTGLSYAQTSATVGTLTLNNGTAAVGALKLAGTLAAGTAFHLAPAADGGSAAITLQTLGLAPAQPALIKGTAGADVLAATANGQVLTGLGGNDTMSAAGFTGVVFKDVAASLNGCAVAGFDASDWFDLTDVLPGTATARYSGGVLTVSDGTRGASISVAFALAPPSGSFRTGADGAGGTKVTWA